MSAPDEGARRRRIAEALRSRSGEIARSVTDEFLRNHPDWIDRYGSAARARGEEDAEFHAKFLAGAILSDSIPAFQDYARWTAGVLGARGIAPGFLAENLEQVGRASREVLPEEADGGTVDRFVTAAVHALDEAGPDRGAPAAAPEQSRTARLYLQAIRSGQRQAALNIVTEAIREGASVPEIYQEVLQPAQYELGRLWERNEITVATEHMATAITQYVMARLYTTLDMPAATHGKAVVTGVSGELHQIGAHMVADMLTAAGWDVRFLGTQLPHRDIVAAVEEHGAGLVGISTTVLANLSAVADLIEELRARFGGEVAVLVGGRAYGTEPDTWRTMGADGFGRDLREAVEVASSFAAGGA